MTSDTFPEPAARVDGGALGVGTGLLMLLREALETLPGGAVVAVRTSDPAVVHDLPAWCRVMAHTYLGMKPSTDGPTYYPRKTELGTADQAKPDWGVRVPLRADGDLHTRDWMAGRVADVPAEAPTTTGFAPRGAIVEAGAPAFDFSINS